MNMWSIGFSSAGLAGGGGGRRRRKAEEEVVGPKPRPHWCTFPESIRIALCGLTPFIR